MEFLKHREIKRTVSKMYSGFVPVGYSKIMVREILVFA